jgi:hypothetical protein
VFTWPQITSDWALGGRGFLGKLKVRGERGGRLLRRLGRSCRGPRRAPAAAAGASPTSSAGPRAPAPRPRLIIPPPPPYPHPPPKPAQGDIWGLSTVVLSFLDWPLRRAFPSVAALSQARPCKPGTHAYDEKVAAELWDVSAEFAGLPKAPQLA